MSKKKQTYPYAQAPRWPNEFEQNSGVPIPDEQIQEWLDEMAKSLRGEDEPYVACSIRSGNTLVYRTIDEEGTITFYVCRDYRRHQIYSPKIREAMKEASDE